MIKTNKNINYGAALTTLFERLKDAEKTTQSNKQDKYPFAYGKLSMAVKMCLVECSDLDLKQIENQIYPPKHPEGYPEAPTLLLYDALHLEDEPNDIPDELFSKPNIHP